MCASRVRPFAPCIKLRTPIGFASGLKNDAKTPVFSLGAQHTISLHFFRVFLQAHCIKIFILIKAWRFENASIEISIPHLQGDPKYANISKKPVGFRSTLIERTGHFPYEMVVIDQSPISSSQRMRDFQFLSIDWLNLQSPLLGNYQSDFDRS